MRPTNIIYCFVTAILLLLAGCATTNNNSANQEQTMQHMSANALYTAGKEAMNLSDHQGAIRHFNTLITQYPVDKFALQGRLELAYAYHKNGQTSSTIATTERFISDHPQHKNIDYAYYLRSLAAYEAAITKLDDESLLIAPPPYEAQMARQFLNELNQRFPDSKYSADTVQRIETLNERIAQRLLFNAKQQLDQNYPAKAALLAKTVIDEYPGSTAIQEAAIITNQAYQQLELHNNEQHDTMTTHMQAAPASQPQPPAVTTPATRRSTNLMPASNEIRDTNWVMSQAPEHYTIQVLGTENEVLLRHQIKSDGLLDSVAYYKKLREGTAWYSLIYGSYATRAEAQAATQTLPASLRQSSPWIRKVGDIQASLESQ